MKSKLKNLIVVLSLFIVASGVSLYLLTINKNSRLDIILDNHSQTVQTYYEILQHNQKTIADVAFEETMRNKKFIDIYTKAFQAKKQNDTKKVNSLRDEAIDLLNEKYKLLVMKGILQYHFVFPDNRVFLRMHKPSKFGDDLTKVRTDFNYTNNTLKVIRGFAQGRTAHAFRNVYPVFNKDDKHIGAMEISFSSELLQNYFTKVNKIHTHFLVRKDIFNSHAWKRDDLILKYNQSAEHDDYMITMTNEHTKEKCIVVNGQKIQAIKDEIKQNIAKKEKFSSYTKFQDRYVVLSFFPILHNITKEPVAWVVSYQDDPLIEKTLQSFLLTKIFLTLGIFVICGFIYFILNQRDILDEIVKEKTASLTKTNRELEEREEDLELLNESLEYKIQEELDKNRQKDKILFEQTKMAAMGEMIGNIAHQWRQPLSVISTGVSGMQVQKECGILKDDYFYETCSLIDKNAKYLSKTIDDFRNFIRGDSKKELFNLNSSIESFMSLVSSSIKKYDLKVDVDIKEQINLHGLQNELNQCLINLFNNARDKLSEMDNERYIKIEVSKKGDGIIVVFHDNGGGIDENIIDKIFEPYFTTKHQAQGTGLGLNMTYRLIVEGMGGTISVMNDTLVFNGKNYKGAKFIISVPNKE